MYLVEVNILPHSQTLRPPVFGVVVLDGMIVSLCMTNLSKITGAFVGVSLEGNIVTTRRETNLRFYGDQYLTPTDILFGMVEARAAQPLYSALDDLFYKMVR